MRVVRRVWIVGGGVGVGVGVVVEVVVEVEVEVRLRWSVMVRRAGMLSILWVLGLFCYG